MLLEELACSRGISGDEKEIREKIKSIISGDSLNIFSDNIGNLYAIREGQNPSKKLMIAAHMDEVGLMVFSVCENGMLKFKPIGNVDDRILASKKVIIGENQIKGVIGAKPIHLQESEERKSPYKIKNMYIDIGCNSKEEAEKYVKPGDYIYFDSEFTQIGTRTIKSKALDDRVGCAVLIEALKGSYDLTLQACFTAQEEVGLRGASIAAYRLKPDCSIIIEGTVCSDIPDSEGMEVVTKMNEGPAISIIDKTSIANRKLFNFVIDTAEKEKIRYQIKEGIYGGNDSGAIQTSCGGVPTIVVSVPCRYIHSPCSILSLDDYEETVKLIRAVIIALDKKNIDFGGNND